MKRTMKIETREQMREAVAQIARLSVETNILRAGMDERIVTVREEFLPRIDAAQKAIKANVAAVKVWALANKAAFGDAKSMDAGFAVIGFRTGTPKVSLLKGWTIERVIEAVKDRFARRGYVRTREELDKEAMIADREKLAAKELDAVGLAIDQDEAFFVDVNLEEAARIVEKK